MHVLFRNFSRKPPNTFARSEPLEAPQFNKLYFLYAWKREASAMSFGNDARNDEIEVWGVQGAERAREVD